jgi:hypothetical protein
VATHRMIPDVLVLRLREESEVVEELQFEQLALAAGSDEDAELGADAATDEGTTAGGAAAGTALGDAAMNAGAAVPGAAGATAAAAAGATTAGEHAAAAGDNMVWYASIPSDAG